jgi:two-component system, OmpR family, response regulator
MRILLIEDQAELHRIIREMLEEDGYSVDSANDGNAGLAKAMTYEYDAIVLDLMLPKMDGWEVLDRLRQSKSTPVMILSALDQTSDRCRGLDEGADDYLPKPFSHEELLSRLRALIRRAAGQSKSLLEFAGVKLDTRMKTVTMHGEAISLTTREYNLLEYLALHRGRVIRREELFDHLFDEIDEVSSNSLDVYVSYLRKKLGADLISTRRGFGYVIE